MRLILNLLALLFLLFFVTTSFAQSNDRIDINGQELFMSGMNMAWGSFAYDMVNLNESTFEQAMDEISDAGGNCMRWWMHINGTQSPQFTNGKVSGITETEIKNVRKVLDMASKRGMVISLCLWSFDMLQSNQGNDYEQNKNLLEDPEYTQAYIDNALIPMVNALKGHPAIMCWEVFNEPEGMTTDFGGAWTKEASTKMKYVQQFINLVAGAIHRTAPDEKVSNGSWSFRASTDVGSNKNYYSDAELIAAGGDSLGTLDFYMVHYYSKHMGTNLSPFHNSASHWGLDKPIVIGEFAANNPYSGISPKAGYEYLYDNGYAGAMSWMWLGSDGNGGVEDAAPGMMSLKTNHPEDIIINPTLSIVEFEAYPAKIEIGQSATLSWKVNCAASVTLDGVVVDAEGTQVVSPTENTKYVLIAVDSSDMTNIDTASVTVSVVDPDKINRALNMNSSASTLESSSGELLYASYAFDGDISTRWSSAWNNEAGSVDPNLDEDPDDEWIQVELETVVDVDEVILIWEVAYGKEYDIDISLDGYNWATVYNESNGQGGTDSIKFTEPQTAKYVRMHGIARATEYGYSIWEFEVYGDASEVVVPTVSLDTYKGNVFKTNTDVTITPEISIATSEIAKVTYIINDETGEDLTESPYSKTINTAEDLEISVSALVETKDGIIVQSAPYIIYSSDREFLRFEAEDSDYNGVVTVATNPLASGNKYLDMTNSWKLNITDIGIKEAGPKLLSIRYMLNYDTPKEQYLVVNDDTVNTLKFTAANLSSWYNLGTKVELEEGANEITIAGFWNWMSIDYFDVEDAIIVGVEDEKQVATKFDLAQNYPNPFNPTTTIKYSITNSANVTLKIYNTLGALVETIVDQYQSAGTYSVNFNAAKYSSGVYFYRLNTPEKSITKSMVLIK